MVKRKREKERLEAILVRRDAKSAAEHVARKLPRNAY